MSLEMKIIQVLFRSTSVAATAKEVMFFDS